MNWILCNEADLYFSKRPFSEKWEELSEEMKEKGLTHAEWLFQGCINWDDAAFSLDENGILRAHERVKAALCEQAIWLIEQGMEQKLSNQWDSLKSLQVGSLNLAFDNKNRTERLAPRAVQLLGKLGVVQQNNGENGSIQASMLEM